MNTLTINSALDVVSMLEASNGKLVINISPDAVGHVLAEFDNFARMRLTGEIAPDGAHLYFGPVEERVSTIAELYGDKLCAGYFLSDLAPEIARNIALFRPDLVVDVGFSSFKIAPVEGKTFGDQSVSINERDKHFIYRTEVNVLHQDGLAYYRRRLSTMASMPMACQFDIPEDLDRLIDLRGKRLALVQIKDFETTGTAEATDPKTYIPALEYLKDQGYQLVQVGREHHPACFADIGVVDYANSSLASFKNDFVLFSNSDISLVGPSGVGIFAEIMGKPYVFTNSWHIIWPPFSPLCVFVPALARSRANGELMNFPDQLKLFPERGVYFPHADYEVVKAKGDDILAATIETLELEKNLTLLNENQQNYRMLAPDTCNSESLSRISATFIERYKHLI